MTWPFDSPECRFLESRLVEMPSDLVPAQSWRSFKVFCHCGGPQKVSIKRCGDSTDLVGRFAGSGESLARIGSSLGLLLIDAGAMIASVKPNHVVLPCAVKCYSRERPSHHACWSFGPKLCTMICAVVSVMVRLKTVRRLFWSFYSEVRNISR